MRSLNVVVNPLTKRGVDRKSPFRVRRNIELTRCDTRCGADGSLAILERGSRKAGDPQVRASDHGSIESQICALTRSRRHLQTRTVHDVSDRP